MTYCVGLKIDRGLVFMSDTRTNAGMDSISTFRKMHVWEEPGERVIVLMSAGNLATTQAVVSLLDERSKAIADRHQTLLETPSMYQTARIVGAVIALMLGVHVVRKWRAPDEAVAHAPAWFGPFAGLLAGFATMVANAAGSVMTLYLLAMRLPKLEFLGTSAAFFLLINWIKVPFSTQLGLLNAQSLLLNLWLLPAVAFGALAGPWVVKRINQTVFENVALVLTALAVLKLLFF